MQENQPTQRREYTTPQLVQAGDFTESTGYKDGWGIEIIFVLPRSIIDF